MEKTTAKIFACCKYLFKEIVELRRDIHAHPEIGFEVERTAGIAAASLENLGAKVRTRVGKSGVVADIDIPGATKRVALRADMDALPVRERGGASYKSKVDGIAHVCGHDAHVAMLIGAATVIETLKSELKVNARFIFQPNEESFPGGALPMIEDGALDEVDEIYALHVLPLLETGKYALGSGPFMARSDAFEIEIVGRGGHAAYPRLANDPILAGAQFALMAQSILPKSVDPSEAAVVQITMFNAGTVNNAIPRTARLSGTVRTMKPEIGRVVEERLKQILAGAASAYDVRCGFAYRKGYPATCNTESCAAKASATAAGIVGADNVESSFPPVMVSEDFGYYTQKTPGCMVLLGAGDRQKGISRMCHDPDFDIDENCLLYGMSLLAGLALEER